MTTTLDKAPDAPLAEVEWRVDGTPVEKQGKDPIARFVPYLDARIVATLLDQWVGPGNWFDTYETGTVAGKEAMWCHLSICVGDAWVTKTDIGVPSNFEPQKGAVSDAFKRAACLKWGAGRNVYDLPTLWAPCRTYMAKGKLQAAANDRTLPALLEQLKRKGYENAEGKVREEPEVATDDDAEQPPANVDPETGEIKQPAPAGDGPTPLERFNALGLKGKQIGECKKALQAQGVPWPPANLDRDQQAAFDDVLKAWTSEKAA